MSGNSRICNKELKGKTKRGKEQHGNIWLLWSPSPENCRGQLRWTFVSYLSQLPGPVITLPLSTTSPAPHHPFTTFTSQAFRYSASSLLSFQSLCYCSIYIIPPLSMGFYIQCPLGWNCLGNAVIVIHSSRGALDLESSNWYQSQFCHELGV